MKIKHLYIIVVILIIILGYSYYNSIKSVEIKEIEESAEESIGIVEEKEEPVKKPEMEIEEVITEFEEEEVTIKIESGFFEPEEISIPVGTTVVWVNNDRRSHKLTDDKRTFYGDRISPGETYAFTFTEAGVYDYFDVVFHTVKGRIIVESETEFYPITGSVVLKQNPKLTGVAVLLLLGVIIAFILGRERKSVLVPIL